MKGSTTKADQLRALRESAAIAAEKASAAADRRTSKRLVNRAKKTAKR